jgi:hypothetical protein
MNTGTSTTVGIGYYDNYKLEIVVPEPATALLFVLGVAVGCGRLLLSRPPVPKLVRRDTR